MKNAISHIKKYEPLWGAWYVETFLGEGSCGQVYTVRREEFGKLYYSAVKIISLPHDDLIPAIDHMSQFRGHSHIVSWEDHQIIEKTDSLGWDILIRMELLQNLADYAAESPLSSAEVVKMGIHICRALDLCTQKNMIHRNIKPENIFISPHGTYKLGDLGISRHAESPLSELAQKGTYTYMAPKILQDSARVDTYSLGLVMYCLLNRNHPPFLPALSHSSAPKDWEKALQRRMSGEPLPPLTSQPGTPDAATRYQRGVSPELNALVLKACAYAPFDRFASSSEMGQALESLTEAKSDLVGMPAMAHTGYQPEKTEQELNLTEQELALNKHQRNVKAKRSLLRFAGLCCAAALLIAFGVFITKNLLPFEDLDTGTEALSLDLSNQGITDEDLATMVKKKEIPKHVTQLNLSSNSITDIGSLKTLTQLTELTLDSNDIQDITFLTSLTHLTRLSLNENENLSDISPLQSLTHLTVLQLKGTLVRDLTPLAEMTHLEKLQLAYTPIQDITPLTSLTNLTMLVLSATGVSDITPLRDLSKLVMLCLDRTQVADVSPLASLTELGRLTLDATHVSNITPLSSLSKLEELTLFDTFVADIEPVASLTKLTQLDIADMVMSENIVTDLTPLTSLTELKTLHMSICSDIHDLTPLKSLTKLTELNMEVPLNLNASDLADTGQFPDMMPLASLTGLTQLKLGHTKNSISNFTFLHSLINLKTLDLTFTDFTDLTLLHPLTNLTELNLPYTGIKDITLLRHWPHLTRLNLDNNPISDFTPLADLTALTRLELPNTEISDITCLRSLKALEYLDLGHNHIHDIAPLKGLVQLEWLSLDYNKMTDITPLQELTEIKHLALKGMSFTDLTPLKSLHKMESFHASGNDISTQQANDLQAALPKCSINLNFY
ncbi:MAG: protein kinase [Peptococcaceae bacterium]|nr:protein kinase [Peptococcaceae bacterium]